VSAPAPTEVRVTSGPRLVVDPAAITANTRVLAAHGPGRLMAVVKADGFGHGAAVVAAAALAGGAEALGVTTIDEGLALRQAGFDVPVLSWLNPVDADIHTALGAGLDLGVPSPQHLAAVIAAAMQTGRRADVHLHVDTGMARDGATMGSWPAICRVARQAERAGLLRVVGIMGHLACADQPGHPAGSEGRDLFLRSLAVAGACGLRAPLRHLAATAATLTDPRSQHTMVRVGAGLVGIDPSGTVDLRTAMTITAPFVQIRRVGAGTSVGYGRTWTAPEPTTLGLLPLGYADGLPRAASGHAEVLVNGRRRPVVGLISMDQVVVDLGDDPVGAGDKAVVLGPGDDGEPTPADWARWAGTLPHEIVTGFGPRVARATADRLVAA
jgi:alanine racemase